MECLKPAAVQQQHCKTFKRLLIIEDSVSLAHHLKEQIDNYFLFHCDLAHTKKEALEMVRRKRYDLVIADMVLPDSNGDLIPELIEQGHRVIVMTGYDNEEKRSEIVKHSVVDYVIKYDAATLDNYLIKTIERLNTNRETVIGICDDSKLARANMVRLVESQNLGYIEFENGQQVLDCISKNDKSFDILLTDYEMPKLDGMEMTRRIRHTHVIDQLPIIAISASDKPSLLAQFLKSGASDYLQKPFQNEEFLTRLNLTLDHLYTIRENARLVEKIKTMASHDFLTQLYNRTYFFEQIVHVTANAFRQQKSYGILVVDIDHFKNVNDTFGHDAGDKLIQHVAGLLKSLARTSDYCFRWGGEEFVILVPSATPTDLEGYGERIRSAMENSAVDIDMQTEPIYITVSIGGAVTLDSNPEELIALADKKLYEAKKAGRNCVRIA